MTTPSFSSSAKPLLRLVSVATITVHALALGQITPGVTYNGNATTYALTGGAGGAAGFPAAEVSDAYAALNDPQWDGSAWGGAWVEVTGPAGTAIVQIVDRCPECPTGSLDIGPVPFQQITGDSTGIYPISWRLVSAPGTPGPVHFYSEASNLYYLKLQSANIDNPVASMEIHHDGIYHTMDRTGDNHFQFLPGSALVQPFTIRLTDIFGNVVVSGGLTLSQTATGQDGSGNFPAIVEEDIVVEQPLGVPIGDGGSSDLGYSIDGSTSTLDFIIRNAGSSGLTGIGITKDGPHVGNFIVTASPASTLPAGHTTPFTIAFTSSTPGLRSAAIHISSSSTVPGLASYDIDLTGYGLTAANDTDTDGLNDAAEARLAALGFDWQVSQPDLVTTYYAGANTAGLFTPSQVQALNVEVPLLQRDPVSGRFTLILGLRKSTDLTTYAPFPFILPDLSVNPSGELEFEFTSPDDAAFFRVESD